MAERRSKKSESKRGFSGNHQRSWLWGHHAVCETLDCGRWPVLELLASEEAYSRLAFHFRRYEEQGNRVEIVGSDRLEQLCRSSEHQGLIARLGAYPYQSLTSLVSDLQLRQASIYGQGGSSHGSSTSPDLSSTALAPLVVICDRIQDGFNFGAILRCCDGAKVLAVIVGSRFQAAMTPHVLRSSSGAANYVSVIETDDLVAAGRQLKSLGLNLIAADSNAPSNLWKADMRGPSAIVLGSEAHGVSPELKELCEHTVTIPMGGHVSSLNVAVAAGILLYEVRRQQGF